MAFKTSYMTKNSDDGRRELTVNEFKRWLMKFDTDKDGRISRKELRQGYRMMVFQVERHRRNQNGNGFVDGCEIENLIQFAEKELGIYSGGDYNKIGISSDPITYFIRLCAPAPLGSSGYTRRTRRVRMGWVCDVNPNDRNLASRRAKCKRRAEPETPSKPSFKVDVTHTGFPPEYPPDYNLDISPKGFSITITHPQVPQPGSSSQPNQPGSSSQAPQPCPYQSFPYQPFSNPQFPPIDFGSPYQPQFVPGYQPNYQPVQEEDTSDEEELSPTTQQEEDIKFYTTPHYHLGGKKLFDTMKRKDEIKKKYG
ncbi:LOW QUALITY PROTEIN: hypothetical protein OSB04_003528, partial [Centaurea solstitialis]